MFTKSKNSKRSAFTLIEIVVTLVVVGIFVSIGVVSISALLKKGALQKGAEMIEKMVIEMRSKAVSQHKVIRFKIEPDGVTFCMQEQTPPPASTWLNEPCNAPIATLPPGVHFRVDDVTYKYNVLSIDGTGLFDFGAVENKPLFTVYSDYDVKRIGIKVGKAGEIGQMAGSPDGAP